MKIKKIKVFRFVIVSVILILIGSCGQVIVGGATTAGLSVVQERSSKQAAIDILIKTKIEEAMFSNSYEKLFSKVRVIVYEGRVLLVGTVEKKETKTEAEDIAWSTKNVKEVGNSHGKAPLGKWSDMTPLILKWFNRVSNPNGISYDEMGGATLVSDLNLNFTKETTNNRLLGVEVNFSMQWFNGHNCE